MSFKKFVCWRADQLSAVMQTDVEYQASSAIFAATHYPLKMYKRHTLDLQARLPYDEESFKREFLDETRPYVFVPVLGEAGSGKSHLLRWLDSVIPNRANRRKLLIPKMDTNLREVLLQILNLDGLSGEPFARFRQRVQESSAHLTLNRAKEELLLHLAVAVGPEGEHRRATLTEQERFFSNNLPNLLKDPFFAAHLLSEQGVIHSLAVQSIGTRSAAERLEQRREFTPEDLPLSLMSARGASALAQQAWQALAVNQSLVAPAIAWLNEHIEQAVMRVFSMGGRDLVRLMREVRVALGEETELIILIEDFMLLQAIDHQLLESLLVRPSPQDGTKLCRMRVALACTSGYFRNLMDTVRTRTDFYVDMDIDVVTGVKEIDATGFAARYLNAARQPINVLERWHDENVQTDAAQPPPSACESCDHQRECHSAFGESDGFGLYPFNVEAIVEMIRRTTGDKFIPREFIKQVLNRVLADYGAEIAAGKFPPPALEIVFPGTPRLSQLGIQELKRMDSRHFERRRVLLDLWSRLDKPGNLNIGVHTAFDLPPLAQVTTPPAPTGGSVLPPPPPPPSQSVSIPLAQRIKDWAKGTYKFTGPEVTQLRDIVFDAVDSATDWDSELLVRALFVGTGRAFRPASINFPGGMEVQESLPPVRIAIPTASEDRGLLAVVLEGLVMRKEVGHWRFDGGGPYLRATAAQLQLWSRRVIEQIRNPNGVPPFDPVAAAVELLAIGQRLLGRPAREGNTLVEQIDALFDLPVGANVEARCDAWQELAKSFQRHRDRLVEIVKERAACKKGRTTKVPMIDAAQLVPPLKRLRKTWVPAEPVPKECGVPGGPFKPLHDFRKDLDRLLRKAVAEERDRQSQWVEMMKRHLGPNADLKTAAEGVLLAADRAASEGVIVGAKRHDLEPLLQSFDFDAFARRVQEISELVSRKDVAASLPGLSRPVPEMMASATSFIEKANAMLENSITRVEQKIKDISDSGGLGTLIEEIERELVRLDQVLGELGGT